MKLRRKVLIAFAFALGVAILVPVIRHYQLRFAVEKYISELKAQGEPMELAQVVPPPVPPEQNGAPLITNALAQLDSDSSATNWVILGNAPVDMNRTIPGKAMAGWHEPVIHSADTWPHDVTNTWDELAAQLASRQNDLSALRSLIEKPVLVFHMNYSDIRDLGLPFHLAKLKVAVQWLEASEYYNLHQGKTTEACADIRTILALIKGTTNERYEISQLVRQALIRMCAFATWNVLQATNISEDNLSQIQADWEMVEITAPLRDSFLFERANELRMIDEFRQSPTNLSWWLGSILPRKGYDYEQIGEGDSMRWDWVDKRTLLDKLVNKVFTTWDESQWRWFWSDQDELHALPIWGVVLEGTGSLATNHSFQFTQVSVKTSFARLNTDSLTNYPFEIMAYNTANQLGAIRDAARAEVARNVVVTAIALKRYELRHHQFPDTLSELVPDFLKVVPTDYMNGQPLHYRRNGNGTFLLYSVGENGKDDGGSPEWEKTSETQYSSPNYSDWQSANALDWVWPQPATEAEVQKFYSTQTGGSE
ncbi:MAG TPA: hypothetical protein VFY06_13900 [Verrucomicrobiae bacterium]|nr:hypothetical protein [Verrucomicrobiae bacterium]